MEQNLLTLGVILYNSEKYLPYFLKSLQEQREVSFQLLIYDHNTHTKESDIVRSYFPDARIIKRENDGFSAGHNALLAETKTPYYACTNPDMIFEPYYFSLLIAFLEKNLQHASVSGKLLYWDFENRDSFSQGKTNIIDSLGLFKTSYHRFIDLHQGKEDTFFDEQDVFGVSGASALYRVSALKDIAYTDEIFDESFFLYKEDIDIAYRLHNAQYLSRCVYNAKAYHHRSISSFTKKPRYIQTLSARNQLFVMIKNFRFEKHTPWEILQSIAFFFITALYYLVLTGREQNKDNFHSMFLKRNR
jgi:GT2 family glycosyltransferase